MEALEIQVLSGMHAGARHTVAAASFRLAGDEHAELILLDEGIEDLELVFSLTEAGDLSVMSRADYEVFDAQGMPVRPRTRWARGQFLLVAGVWLGLALAGAPLMERPVARQPELAQVFSAALKRPAARAPTPAVATPETDTRLQERRAARRVATIALGSIVATVLVAGMGVALLAVSAENSLQSATATVAKAAATSASLVTSATSATLAPTAEEIAAQRIKAAQESLARLIERAGMGQNVTLDWQGDTVSIHARINSSAVAQFEQMMLDFERDHGQGVKVSAKVTPLWALLPFRVREVVAGANGWIVTDEGERVLVGGEIGGYKITSVGAERVVLSGPYRVEIDL